MTIEPTNPRVSIKCPFCEVICRNDGKLEKHLKKSHPRSVDGAGILTKEAVEAMIEDRERDPNL